MESAKIKIKIINLENTSLRGVENDFGKTSNSRSLKISSLPFLLFISIEGLLRAAFLPVAEKFSEFCGPGNDR